MIRFDSRNLCPNCGGHGALPQGQGNRCWGLSYENSFLCTREELSENCKETDTGYLHYYVRCRCGRPHDGTKVKTAQPTYNFNKNNNRNFAEKVWNDSINPQETSTQDYLISRGIKILSDQIKHHKELEHTPTKQYCEAMVVRVSDYQNKFMAIERHYLKGGRKAFDAQQKMTLGTVRGGSVKLAKLDGSGVLGVAEGVVTALTLVQELGMPVWACIGAGNIPNLKLPPLGIINTVDIFTDGDKDGLKAVDKAGDIWLKQGYEVRSVVAPIGQDYNDILNGGKNE